MSSRSIIVRRG